MRCDLAHETRWRSTALIRRVANYPGIEPRARCSTGPQPGANAQRGSLLGWSESWRRLAAKVAAWSTIPASTYCSGVCTERSLPLEQIGSSSTHKSMVLSAYSGPTAICGSLIARINRVFGFPIKATAATRSATSGGIGFGTPSGAPSGMTFAVTKPITAAPWEYPPSTSLVSGQLAAMDRTRALAS